MSRTTRVKNKNERKYLIDHSFWLKGNDPCYCVARCCYWELREVFKRDSEYSYDEVLTEYNRRDNDILRGRDRMVSKTGNYSNKNCREYVNRKRAKVRDRLKKINLENCEDYVDCENERKYYTSLFRWFVLP